MTSKSAAVNMAQKVLANRIPKSQETKANKLLQRVSQLSKKGKN